MNDVIAGHLEALYGPAGSKCLERLSALASRMPRTAAAERRPLSERDAILITYADQIQADGLVPLRALGVAARRWWSGLVSAVHILPFYPSTSDDGFAVTDYMAVDPALGSWEDVRALGADFELMFDAVFNHMSAQSEWFRRFLAGDPEFEDFFVTVTGAEDLSLVVRPRALPLITEFESSTGIRRVWTTFSEDQVDLNARNPAVLLRLVEVLLWYVAQGARWIRLDAVAYLWKESSTTCIHRPETHRVIRLFRSVLDECAPSTRLITETNVPHRENISYFGDGTNEAQLVYNFALPPLVWHTMRAGDATALAAWAQTLTLPSEEVTFFNFLASHDGIGLNPARGLLSEADIDALIERAVAHGGFVSYKSNPDGTRSPYELNINFFDALSDPRGGEPMETQVARFLCAHSILLSLQGVPGIYVHSLLGSRGDRRAAETSGIPRRINRAKLRLAGLELELSQPDSLRARVYGGMRPMLEERRRHAVFRPASEQMVFAPRPEVLVIRRGNPAKHAIWCVHNVSARKLELPRMDPEVPEHSCLRNLLDAHSGEVRNGLRLDSYEVRWLCAS